jgi:hypothetical protein
VQHLAAIGGAADTPPTSSIRRSWPKAEVTAEPQRLFCGVRERQQFTEVARIVLNNTLTNRVSIEVRSASFRRLRGPTYLAVIADEAAFWYSEGRIDDVGGMSAAPPIAARCCTGGYLNPRKVKS